MTKLKIFAGASAVLLAVTACSGGAAAASNTSDPAVGKALAAGVSKALLDKGVLNVATDAAYPPAESIDTATGKVVGFDPDLINAMGAVLGLKINLVNVDFGGLLPGVTAGRYDAAMSSITDTKEREKTVDFVDYATVGSGLLVQAGNPKNIRSLADMCGLQLSSEVGSDVTQYAKTESDRCMAAGKQPIAILQFPSAAQAQLQLQAGRVDAIVHDYPLAQNIADTSGGKFSVAPDQFLPSPSGIAVAKNRKDVADALLYALKTITADGTYRNILAKWKLESLAIDKPGVNQAAN